MGRKHVARLSAGVAFDINRNERTRKPFRYAGVSYSSFSRDTIQAYRDTLHVLGAGIDSSSCSYATQKHESGSVCHNSVRFSRWISTKLVWWAPTTQALAPTQRHGAIMTAKCSEENVDQGH